MRTDVGRHEYCCGVAEPMAGQPRGDHQSDELTPEEREARAFSRWKHRRAAEREFRRQLESHGFAPNPYARLVVLTALVDLVSASDEHMHTRWQLEPELVDRTGLPRTQVRLALRAVRRAGCLLDSRSQPVLDYRGRFAKLASDDPLVLDELCIQAITRVAEAAFPAIYDDPDLEACFRQFAGVVPQGGPQRRTRVAVEEIRSTADIAPAPSTKGRIFRELARVGLDPVPAHRPTNLARICDLIEAVPDTLTPADVTTELEADGPRQCHRVSETLNVLMKAGALRDQTGESLEDASQLVGSVTPNDLAELERACRSAYRSFLEEVVPEVVRASDFDEALQSVLTTPKPLARRDVVVALANKELHPEPTARSTILKALLELTTRAESVQSFAELAESVAAIEPVTKSQVYAVLQATWQAETIIGPGGNVESRHSSRPPAVMRFQPADLVPLDRCLVALYREELAPLYPELNTDSTTSRRFDALVSAL